jgi:hypothetical protein
MKTFLLRLLFFIFELVGSNYAKALMDWTVNPGAYNNSNDGYSCLDMDSQDLNPDDVQLLLILMVGRWFSNHPC